MQTLSTNILKLIYAFIVWLATATVLFAAPCPEHITADSWINNFAGDKQTQLDFFARLRTCLPGDEKKQEEVDKLAVNSLVSLESLPKEDQKSLVAFTLQALLINAKAGFPSSQHNYAALHNAEPDTLLQRLVAQNYSTFIYWTRKAAAQKEPRALFNLATRMADGEPVQGLPQDLPTAYTILAFLEHFYSKEQLLPPEMLTYIKKTREKISKKLGVNRTRQLDATITTFDFSTLAPTAQIQ